jgi:hypothetical protein
MSRMHGFRVSTAVLAAGIAIGCGSSASPTQTSSATAAATVVPSPTRSATPAPTIVPATRGGPAAEPTSTPETINRDVERTLDAGTYRLAIEGLPAFLITVPDGWASAFSISRPRAGYDLPPVVVLFWDVDQVYGHPCQWQGTLFQPGPTVDDLAEALVDIPLRNATQPVDVTLDGASGKYLEWSVPADIETEPHGEFTSFDDCDRTQDGDRAFESWTGKAGGSDRYQQAAGQVDRLWILDVEGIRLVIDAFEMPYATTEEKEQLTSVVESIKFER